MYDAMRLHRSTHVDTRTANQRARGFTWPGAPAVYGNWARMGKRKSAAAKPAARQPPAKQQKTAAGASTSQSDSSGHGGSRERAGPKSSMEKASAEAAVTQQPTVAAMFGQRHAA